MTVRRRGAYAPLSATYAADDAIMEAGEAAELLYVRALAFCSSSDSDGFITRAQLVRWVGAGMLDAEDRAKKLVEVGLWVTEHGGYQIRSWLEWNDSTEDKGRKRRKDRERKANERAVHADTPPDDGPGAPPPNGPDVHAKSVDLSTRSPNGQVDTVHAESERTGDGSPPESRCLDTEHGSTGVKETEHSQGQTRGRSRAGVRDPDRFDEFWLAFPKKVDKGHARTAWAQMLKRGMDPEVVIPAASQFGERVRNADPKYIPHPATWLRGERWEDEQDVVRDRPEHWG